MADSTILQIDSGDITTIINSGDITTIVGAPISVALTDFSDAAPSDISRTANSGVLAIASRADHIHSIANTLLDGGNY